MKTAVEGRLLSKELIKSKQRVADHGEVFTPGWLIDAMLDLVKCETSRIESRFLEPACGDGGYLVRILQLKFAAVEVKFGKSDFDRRHYALLALMNTYGIEILKDNITECRANMLDVFVDFLAIKPPDDFSRAASYVLSLNLVHGDALEMRAYNDSPIAFAQWEYLGKGKFQRQDFRMDALAPSSGVTAKESLFDGRGVPKSLKNCPPITVRELARATMGSSPRGSA